MSKIVAVRREPETNFMSEFKLDDGSIIGFDECVNLVERGKLPECQLGQTRDGKVTIKSKRGVADYSLSKLPTF